MTFWLELKTMTKWVKVGDTFEPLGHWRISRSPSDVINAGVFAGPYQSKEEDK